MDCPWPGDFPDDLNESLVCGFACLRGLGFFRLLKPFLAVLQDVERR